MSFAPTSLVDDGKIDADRWCLDHVINQDSEPHFKWLFDKYYSHLCQLSFSKLRCEHKAQEVVSDVYVKLWQKRRALQIKGKVISYLRRAVINQTIDYLRDSVRHRSFCNPLPEGRDFVAEEPALNELYAQELALAINKVIATLPPQGQKIFRMSRDEGMTYSQIAAALDISPRTVETHVRRSLVKIRKELSL